MLVFDTGPLRHFAVQGWLGVLKFIAAGRTVVVPESVEDELDHQTHEQPAIRQVLSADWITVDRRSDIDFLIAFATYEDRLVADGKNRGECGVLALGKVLGWEVVLDDNVARTIAEEDGLHVTCTLSLLCDAIRAKQLTVAMVEALADDLLEGDYYLPFRAGGFRRWALEEGHLDFE
ncbi:MAG: nucleotide-binding protein [Micropruina sp.]|uniref:nucleotide-binding protein n=1 Tax=Micropruina sp. TaxID=2737536 RepID=UPI0039E53BA9